MTGGTRLEGLLELKSNRAKVMVYVQGPSPGVDFMVAGIQIFPVDRQARFKHLKQWIDKGEAQMVLMKKEIQEFTSECVVEAEKMAANVESDARDLDLVEKEAAKCLKASKLSLQEVISTNEEETQMCARELLALVDSVSKHKEYMS